MIAEEDISSLNDREISSSIERGKSISLILLAFKKTTPHFKKIVNEQNNISNSLNENNLTQFFVEQTDVQLRKMGIDSFSVKNQYSDFFHKTKGIPDFYFHYLEEGEISLPIFIVEAKRLPAPEKRNQKEYTKGIKNNGGIERFKIGKHGKGQTECGIIGFIETESFQFWKKEVNTWIQELALSDNSWSKKEVLKEIETKLEFAYLTSIAQRNKSNDSLLLHHFWINCL